MAPRSSSQHGNPLEGMVFGSCPTRRRPLQHCLTLRVTKVSAVSLSRGANVLVSSLSRQFVAKLVVVSGESDEVVHDLRPSLTFTVDL